MSASSNRLDPRVRLAIVRWPEDAPRGAVSTFCAEQSISRKTFYAIRARARDEGEAAALEPRSTRPLSSPTAISADQRRQALAVRAALASSGLDNGPISVHDKMEAMGLPAPSPASLARIFRAEGVARAEPSKRPRSAWRRFVYPAPNACWQLDATEYVLTGGRKAVIFQLQDDHSRLAVASLVAAAETSQAAVAVFDKGVAAHGVPQRLLTDNGVALNPTRRGVTGRLVDHVRSLGVEPITGKPYKPTTQGKNERLHRTLFRYLDAQPLASTIAELQALVDDFDRIYNTERRNQSLPGRITPQQAWDATPVAEPPRPTPPVDVSVGGVPAPPAATAPAGPTRGARLPRRRQTPPSGTRTARIRANGTANLASIAFLVSRAHAGTQVIIDWDPHTITFTTTDGEVLAQHTWPALGVQYVSNNPRRKKNPEPPQTSPKS